MIENISNYASNIITLIIAITIVELLLPNNKNKKYIMFTCSLIVMLSVINPILAFLNSDVDISNKITEVQKEMQKHECNSVNSYDLEYNIYNTYIDELENNMIARLEDIGYKVLESHIIVDKTTYEPTRIAMKVEYADGDIQPIVIDVFGDNNKKMYDVDINKIKDVLSSSYGVDKKDILIN